MCGRPDVARPKAKERGAGNIAKQLRPRQILRVDMLHGRAPLLLSVSREYVKRLTFWPGGYMALTGPRFHHRGSRCERVRSASAGHENQRSTSSGCFNEGRMASEAASTKRKRREVRQLIGSSRGPLIFLQQQAPRLAPAASQRFGYFWGADYTVTISSRNLCIISTVYTEDRTSYKRPAPRNHCVPYVECTGTRNQNGTFSESSRPISRKKLNI